MRYVILPAELRPLADSLTRWAEQGGLRELQAVLRGQLGDQRDRCFSGAFLDWLGRLDARRTLADLDKLSAPDFDDRAAPVLDRLSDPLHGFFARRGEMHVLWRLACVVGLVANQRLGSATCPEAWKRDFPVLHRLFAVLEPLTARDGNVARSRAHTENATLRIPPRVVWEVDLQQVVALLPEQTVPSVVNDLRWRVNGVETPPPQRWSEPDGVRIEESQSHALAPKAVYQIETEVLVRGAEGRRTQRSTIVVPEEFTPCVLFTAEGLLLGCEDGAMLHPGEYLALVPKSASETLAKRRGVRLLESIPISPVGWSGWKAWRLHIDAGADIAPWLVEGQLLCRLVGAGFVAEGRAILDSETVRVYEINLHRWRDGFDRRAGGMVQVRSTDYWLNLAQLQCDSGSEPPSAPTSEQGKLFAEMEEALRNDDYAATHRLAERSASLVESQRSSIVEREILVLEASRVILRSARTIEDLQRAADCLRRIGQRPDLPETAILEQTLTLRLSARVAGHHLSLETVQDLGHSLPDLPLRSLCLAECWYHRARIARGSAPGLWRSCVDAATDYLAYPGIPLAERREARLLRALARLMLGLEQAPETVETLAEPNALLDAWFDGVRLVGQAAYHLDASRSSAVP